MFVCIYPCECVFEGDNAEEEECKTEESEKGDGFSSHSGNLFSRKMYFQFSTKAVVHGLHKDDGGGIEHKGNASQRAASFHIPKYSLVSLCSNWCTVSGYILLRAATHAHAWLWKIHFVLLEPSRTIINRMKTKPSRQRFSGCPSQAYQCQLPWDFTFTWREACLIMRH